MTSVKDSWQWFGIVFLAFSVIFGLFWNIVSSLDNFYYDSLTGLVNPSSDITIVAIDEKTLDSLGKWPLNRDRYGELVNKLNEGGAKVIGLNIIFDGGLNDGSVLSEGINNSNSEVTLASDIELEDVEDGHYGYTNLPFSVDGNIREVNLTTNKNNKCYNSFSLNILLQFQNNSVINCKNKIELLNKDINNNIYFETTKSSFNTVSMIDVIESRAPSQLIDGKIVLIGVTNSDQNNLIVDRIQIHSNKSMPSVEVQANIINSLLIDKYKVPPSFTFQIIIFIVIFLSLFVFYKFNKSIKAIILISLCYQIISIVLGLLLFEFGYLYPAVTISVLLFFSLSVYLILKLIVFINQTDLLKEAFTRYVSKDVLQDIIKSNDSEVLKGKKQEITTLFCDIRGFTALSEQLSPEELFKILNVYFGEVSAIIVKKRGTLDKYMGDAIMAFWNAPLKLDKHALSAVVASLEILKAVQSLHIKNKIFKKIHVGIGINTGDVLVGNLGSKIRYDYTVIGDDVNLASRLENLTKRYGVDLLIGQKTYLDIKDILPDEYLIRQIDQIRVKGKNKPVKIYEVAFNNPLNIDKFDKYKIIYNLYKKGQFDLCLREISKYKILNSDNPSNLIKNRIDKLQKENIDMSKFDHIWNWKEK